MKRNKKKRGLESLRARHGYLFVSHWMLGLLLFFVIPAISSIVYAFSNISIVATGFQLKFVALANFKEILFENPDYVDSIRDSLGSMFYSLPMVVSLSLILAVLLNQKYPGRTFFRIVFFLPVIISSSVIVKLLEDPTVNASVFSISNESTSFLNFEEILAEMALPEQLNGILSFFLTNAVNLTWNCGVQTILFLAGLQSIPGSLYEVSKIEGANKWEEFWKITVPMLRHVLSLVIIYTMISLFTAATNPIMTSAIKFMGGMDYGVASAMLWFYFIIVLVVIGIALAIYNRYCVKKWD
ncbi:MAG: sugar ABC transporter permease [Clostridia bacterium]|nr:sugar ABC transporter permease [Clostridia bacterium]